MKFAKKAARQINVLKRLSKFLNFKTRLAIFNSFILSHFYFCPLIWHHCNKSSTKKMERVQERALRFVYQDFDSNYEALLLRAELPTFELGRLRNFAIQVFKILNDLAPSYLSDLIISRKTTDHLRSGPRSLHQPSFKTTKHWLHSFRFLAPKVWNNLPPELRQAKNYTQFKNLIKTWEGLEGTCRCAMCRH